MYLVIVCSIYRQVTLEGIVYLSIWGTRHVHLGAISTDSWCSSFSLLSSSDSRDPFAPVLQCWVLTLCLEAAASISYCTASHQRHQVEHDPCSKVLFDSVLTEVMRTMSWVSHISWITFDGLLATKPITITIPSRSFPASWLPVSRSPQRSGPVRTCSERCSVKS